MQQFYNLGPQAWLYCALLLSMSINLVLAIKLLARKAPKPVQYEPTNQAAAALAVYGFVGAILVSGLGYIGFLSRESHFILALLAIFAGFGLLADILRRVDRFFFRRISVDPPR